MLADFYIIGAMKCGTSTLQAQLAALPDVFMTTPKEPNFFSDPDIYAKGMGWYENLFALAGPDDLRGEASTHYTKWPDLPLAPARVAKATPDAKLIYMVRDPVARAVSHYRHEWTMGNAPSDPGDALTAMPAIWQYSLYATQLKRWLEYYPKERVLVSSLERMKVDPDGEFDRVLSFLGRQGAWQHDLEAQNVGAERIKRLPFHNILIDNPVARGLRRSLVPQSIRQKIADSRKPKDIGLSDEVKLQIADKVTEDIAVFGEMVGVDLTPQNFKTAAAAAPFHLR